MKFTCFTEVYDSMIMVTVEADSHLSAAVQAATREGMDGAWVVVQGDPITVRVEKNVRYVHTGIVT